MYFIQRLQFKDAVMVPLVGIMFGNVIGGVTSFLAYKFEMTQALSTWLVGHFSMVLKGRYEIVYLVVPLVAAAFYSDYICAFKSGRIEKYGTVDEVITKEVLSRIYQVDFEIMRKDGKPLTIYY